MHSTLWKHWFHFLRKRYNAQHQVCFGLKALEGQALGQIWDYSCIHLLKDHFSTPCSRPIVFPSNLYRDTNFPKIFLCSLPPCPPPNSWFVGVPEVTKFHRFSRVRSSRIQSTQGIQSKRWQASYFGFILTVEAVAVHSESSVCFLDRRTSRNDEAAFSPQKISNGWTSYLLFFAVVKIKEHQQSLAFPFWTHFFHFSQLGMSAVTLCWICQSVSVLQFSPNRNDTS